MATREGQREILMYICVMTWALRWKKYDAAHGGFEMRINDGP